MRREQVAASLIVFVMSAMPVAAYSDGPACTSAMPDHSTSESSAYASVTASKTASGPTPIAAPAACGQPTSDGAQPLASDALWILRSAVGLVECLDCVCDVDGSNNVSAADALIDLKKAVGQAIELACPTCSITTTTTSGSTTTVVTPTTTTTGGSTTTVVAPTTTLPGLFEASNPWNENVEAMAVSPNSASIIAALENKGGWGYGTLRIDFSIHVLEADADTPRMTFSQFVDYTAPDCDPSFPFPVPVGGAFEGHDDYTCDPDQEDCHLIVVERDEKRLYEMYDATITDGVLWNRCAVVWDLTHAYSDVLRGEQCTSADAAGLPIAALLFTPDEVAAGKIEHAIRFILPNDRMHAGVYVHPATHAGAPSGDANLPPYGVRFRLRADYPVDSLANPNARVIARAMQTYGMILADGGNIALTAASDRGAAHTWAELGIDSYSLSDLQVSDFEVLAFDTPIALTYDCVRAD